MSAGTREGETLVDHQGQVVELRLRVAELEGREAEFMGRLSSVAEELESRAELYSKGEANDAEWRIQRTRGLAAGSRDAAGLIRAALSDPSPPAQERIRELEEALTATEKGSRQLATELLESENRLDRLRPVVRAALATRGLDGRGPLNQALDALTPEDRAWAEGE